MAAGQGNAVQCDSCGCWSAEREERHEQENTLTAGETSTMFWCIDCSQNVCSSCVVVHRSSHCVVPLPVQGHSELMGLPCPSHADCSSDLFCWHCRQLVCAACATSLEHRDHSCDDVTSSAVRLRTQLHSDVTALDRRRRRCDELAAEVSADKHDWLGSVQAVDNELRAAVDELRTLVDRHWAALSDELAALKQSRLKELQSRLEDAEQERSSLDGVCRNIQTVVDSVADVQLLAQAGSLRESVERCLVESPVTSHGDFHQTVVFVPSAVPGLSPVDAGSLLGRLQVGDA